MRKKSFYWIAQVVVLIFASSWATSTSYGQDLEKGRVEATALAGLVSGIGTHGSLAGAVGTAVADNVFAFGEFSYIPLGGGTIDAFGFRSGGSAKAYGLNFGAQYLFRKSGSVAPYAGDGLGLLTTPSTIRAWLEAPLLPSLPAEPTPISASAVAFAITRGKKGGVSNQN